ncbi:MAG: hypothetical protein F6J87_10535 [Spirulina sp. SIO3F2]|nr:hypothetical protein [Spirulina sp. SIO3F2]
MKFWSSLPLIVAIFLFGAVSVGCGDSADVDSEPVAEEEVEEDDEEYAEGEEEEYEEGDEGEEEVAEDGEYEAAEFTLVNDTDRPLVEFYVSPPSSEEWEENLIPEDAYLGPRKQIQVVINDGRPDCAYDILGVLGPSEDGSVGEGELIHSGVEICDGTTYTYAESGAE